LFSAPQPPLVRLGNLFPQRELYAKCEFLAPSGCFKIRGARHLLNYLSKQGQLPSLVVPSSGNTAVGAAVAAKAYGARMVGVVPTTIARAKDEKLQALGVELVKIVGGGNQLLQAATQLARERGGYFAHPHLDPHWTDGYQAIAEEILADVPDCRSLVFPVGGGGLLMGLTEFLRQKRAEIKLYGCEPFNYPTYAHFTHSRSATIADGLLMETPHPQVQQRIADAKVAINLVEEGEIRSAMAGLFVQQGLIVEPSSAITTAFVESRAAELEEPICVILTGENIAREEFWKLIIAMDQPVL
jgi:threonine dehydratase